jgi:acetyl esterase/lipase
MQRTHWFLGLAAALTLSAAPVALAQTIELPEPTRIEVTASDDLVLVGDFYAQMGDPAPAVLLMHMNNSRRSAWAPLLAPLYEDGYNILNVDLRGLGESGSTKDWPLAIQDVQLWLDWLREQPSVDDLRVATLGGSIGSNLALVGCANDADCYTAIALSPGMDYFGVRIDGALNEGLSRRPALLITAHSDRGSSEGVRQIAVQATGPLGIQFFPGALHGTALLGGSAGEITIPMILNWLDMYQPEAE